MLLKSYVEKTKCPIDGAKYVYEMSYNHLPKIVIKIRGGHQIGSWHLNTDFFEKFSIDDRNNMPLTPALKLMVDEAMNYALAYAKKILQDALKVYPVAIKNKNKFKGQKA